MGWLVCDPGSKLAPREDASDLAQAQTAGQSPGQVKRGLRANAPGMRPGTSGPARKKALFLLAGARFLGGPEGNSSAHGLLLDRSGSPAELAGDRARGSSRLGELFQGLQFTGAPGGAVIRGTLCHQSSLQSHPGRASSDDSGGFRRPRAQHGVLTCCKSLCFVGWNSSLHMTPRVDEGLTPDAPPPKLITGRSVPQTPRVTAAGRRDRRRKRPRTAALADSNPPRCSRPDAMRRVRLRARPPATQTR